MSDPADKSDDLIAELAKLMAASPGGDRPAVAPVTKPVPNDPAAAPQGSAPAPSAPVRIPGMDPRPAAAAPSAAPAAPAPVARAPVTGAIRIPGMDNPAPVAASAPVSKFDFGARPISAAPIKQEPLSTFSERLAPKDPVPRVEPAPGVSAAQPAPAPIRIPSEQKPAGETFAAAQGSAVTVNPPAEPPKPAAKNDFSFDFGFERNPPVSASPPRPTEEPQHDPIADLIASSMEGPGTDADSHEESPDEQRDAPRAEQNAPVQATPIPVPRIPSVAPQPVAQKPAMSPLGAAAPRNPNAQHIPLKPVSVAPRAPESDRFAAAPGANIKAVSQPLGAPVQRAPEPARPALGDPMSEIEDLIGEAVRVELSPPGPVRVQSVQQRVEPRVELEPDMDVDGDGAPDTASAPIPVPRAIPGVSTPVVPPLNTQFAPRRTGLKDEPGHTSAEDAILAAAAATGAQVDHVEPSLADERPYRRLKVKPARSSFASGGIRQYVGMAVAGTLLLAAGLGLYWVLNMGRADVASTGENAPQLTADATPVKEAPTASTEDVVEPARSPVLEQIGGTSAAPGTEQLVSTDQTTTTPVTRDVTNPPAATGDTEGGLANRKVRTVTVRPDGTIVSGDDAVAGAEALPVDRPNVPEMPSSDTTNLLGDSTTVAATDPAQTGGLTTTPAPLADATTPAAAPTAEGAIANAGGVAPRPISFPVRSTTAAAFTPTAPAQSSSGRVTGAQTPNGQIDLLGSPIETASAPPAAVDAGSAAAFVQLSSNPSRAEAESSLRTLNNRYGSLFGGSQPGIYSADLGQKGTWYRVKLPASSLASAQSICSSIKANGGDCIVSGN